VRISPTENFTQEGPSEETADDSVSRREPFLKEEREVRSKEGRNSGCRLGTPQKGHFLEAQKEGGKAKVPLSILARPEEEIALLHGESARALRRESKGGGVSACKRRRQRRGSPGEGRNVS